LIFIAGALLQQRAKKITYFPPRQASPGYQMACCEHGLKRTDLLRTWSVLNGCAMNVVCYQRAWFVMNVVCYELICYERGLFWTGALWTWSIINVHGLLWTWSVMNWSVMNMVCYERVCFKHGRLCALSVFKRGLLWTGLLWMCSVFKCGPLLTGQLWTGSVMNRSVTNVVCYEREPFFYVFRRHLVGIYWYAVQEHIRGWHQYQTGNKYHKQAALRLVGPALRLTRIIFECSGVRKFRKYYDSSR